MGRKSNWAIALFAAGVGGVIAAVIGAAQIATTTPGVWSAPWFISVLCVAAVFFLIAAVLSIGDFQERPRIEFGEPLVLLRGINAVPPQGSHLPLSPLETVFATGASVSFGTYATTHVGPSHTTAWFAYVPIENRPRRGDRDAANVKARLRFLDDAGAVITEMNGRWSDTDMDFGRDKILRAPEVPLPANGNPRLVEVAFKYIEDDQCFAMNDENVIHSMLRYRPLGNRLVRVHIEVRGSGCRGEADFDLTHEGVGSHQRLTRRTAHASPLWLKPLNRASHFSIARRWR